MTEWQLGDPMAVLADGYGTGSRDFTGIVNAIVRRNPQLAGPASWQQIGTIVGILVSDPRSLKRLHSGGTVSKQSRKTMLTLVDCYPSSMATEELIATVLADIKTVLQGEPPQPSAAPE